MGCDIHLWVERKVNGQWTRVVDVPESVRDPWMVQQAAKLPDDPYYTTGVLRRWYHDRNYFVFAVLAGVRNSWNVTPIAEPRGWPEDMDPTLAVHITRSDDDDDEETYYQTNSGDEFPGDHSASWLTVAELLAHDWDQPVEHQGMVGLTPYMEWKASGAVWPPTYCGGVFGQGVEVILEKDAAATHRVQQMFPQLRPNAGGFGGTYVASRWTTTHKDSAGRFYTTVLPALAALDPDPANVRIVFNFDS